MVAGRLAAAFFLESAGLLRGNCPLPSHRRADLRQPLGLLRAGSGNFHHQFADFFTPRLTGYSTGWRVHHYYPASDFSAIFHPDRRWAG